jgi:hypothetical protein
MAEDRAEPGHLPRPGGSPASENQMSAVRCTGVWSRGTGPERRRDGGNLGDVQPPVVGGRDGRHDPGTSGWL